MHSKTFICSTKEEMKKIQFKVALDPQYECDICNKKYSSLSALRIHKIRHRQKSDLPFECMFCPYKSATKRDLLRHHNQHIGHARQIFKCTESECSKVFKNISSLNNHIRGDHSKEVMFQCGVCGYSTGHRSRFSAHLRTHAKPELQAVCPICDSFFLNKSNLKAHIMTHADGKRFECSKCGQGFVYKSRLTMHDRTVHGSKDFSCEICQKSFPTSQRLDRHVLTHSGGKPFGCCFCPLTCNTQGNLIKHIKNVHHKAHFTYKDVLRVNGEEEDVFSGVSPTKLKEVKESCRETSEAFLKRLRQSGMTSSSIDQLQEETKKKRKQKEDLCSARLRKKRDRRRRSCSSEDIDSPSACLQPPPELLETPELDIYDLRPISRNEEWANNNNNIYDNLLHIENEGELLTSLPLSPQIFDSTQPPVATCWVAEETIKEELRNEQPLRITIKGTEENTVSKNDVQVMAIAAVDDIEVPLLPYVHVIDCKEQTNFCEDFA